MLNTSPLLIERDALKWAYCLCLKATPLVAFGRFFVRKLSSWRKEKEEGERD